MQFSPISHDFFCIVLHITWALSQCRKWQMLCSRKLLNIWKTRQAWAIKWNRFVRQYFQGDRVYLQQCFHDKVQQSKGSGVTFSNDPQFQTICPRHKCPVFYYVNLCEVTDKGVHLKLIIVTWFQSTPSPSVTLYKFT